MLSIFGMLHNNDRASHSAELESALEKAGVRPTNFFGSSLFLALGEHCTAKSIVADNGTKTVILGHSSTVLQAADERTEPTAHLSGSMFDPAIANGPLTFVQLAADGRRTIGVDRFGQHRVVYSSTASGEIVFASEIGLLGCHPDISFQLDNQAIYNYLFFHAVPSPGSIYKGISKLPPANMLEYDGSRHRVIRYWTPRFANELEEPLAQKTDAVVPTVTDAVRRCGVGIDTGAFLSGGLDSSTVCGALQSLRSEPAKAFSVGFAAEGYDEIRFAEAVARHFGLDHNVHYITPEEVCEAVPRVAQAYDEPFGNSSAVPTLVCAEFAKSCGINSLLAGDGGDEIFSGNTRYRKQKIFQGYFSIPRFMRSNFIEPLFATRGQTSILGKGILRKVSRYVDQPLVPLPERMETHNLLQMVALTDVLDPGFMAAINTGDPFELMRQEWDSLGEAHYQDKMLYLDWKQTLADNDLRKVGQMTSLAGVEVFYPLLDNAVVELATSIPARVRLRGMRLRHFYRESVRSYLPKETLTKSKHGFGLPFGEWARVDPGLREITMDALTGLRQRRILKESFLSKMTQQHMKDHAGFYGTMVWVLMMLELWLDAHDLSG